MGSLGDSLASETNLRRWGYQKGAECPLCKWKCCNMQHVLSTCPIALQQEEVQHDAPLHQQIRFVRAGERCVTPPKVKVPLIRQAADWKVIMDLNGKWQGDGEGIPTHVVAHTLERPDIVMWSDTLG